MNTTTITVTEDRKIKHKYAIGESFQFKGSPSYHTVEDITIDDGKPIYVFRTTGADGKASRWTGRASVKFIDNNNSWGLWEEPKKRYVYTFEFECDDLDTRLDMHDAVLKAVTESGVVSTKWPTCKVVER